MHKQKKMNHDNQKKLFHQISNELKKYGIFVYGEQLGQSDHCSKKNWHLEFMKKIPPKNRPPMPIRIPQIAGVGITHQNQTSPNVSNPRTSEGADAY